MLYPNAPSKVRHRINIGKKMKAELWRNPEAKISPQATITLFLLLEQ